MDNADTEKRFVAAEEADVQNIDEYMTVYEYLNKDDVDGASIVTADLDGPHERRVNHRSEKSYFVLDGSVELKVEDEEYKLTHGDAAVVRPGEAHELVGNDARMLVIISPPYDPDDEEFE